MSDSIPFVNGRTDCELVRQFYSDSKIVRLSWDNADNLRSALPRGIKLWLDPGFDTLYNGLPEASGARSEFAKCIHRQRPIVDSHFWVNPDRGQLKEIVSQILNACKKHKPTALTIPQWPIKNDIKYNKLNRYLADATAAWKSSARYPGKLILPAIFTNQEQLNKKIDRNKKLGVIKACYERSGADGIWVVDSSLADQNGGQTLRDKRFPGVIKFQEEINEALDNNAITIAGPYWGLNLVLWAKGLCRHPAIGVGSAYRYYIPSQHITRGVNRLALPGLRRWVRRSPELKRWLSDAIDILKREKLDFGKFAAIKSNFPVLSTQKACRSQIAQFYKEWLDEIEKIPLAGRAPALFQLLSLAYAIGKKLPPLPEGEGVARRPERVAENLMLNCL